MPETETPPRILQGDLSGPIPSHVTPCTSLICNPNLSHSFSHKLLTHELCLSYILPFINNNQKKKKKPLQVSLVTTMCEQQLPFFPYLHFSSLPCLTWNLSGPWANIECQGQESSECLSCSPLLLPNYLTLSLLQNHSSFNVDIIWIYHCFLHVLTLFCQLPTHTSSFTSLLFLASFPFHPVSFL